MTTQDTTTATMLTMTTQDTITPTTDPTSTT